MNDRPAAKLAGAFLVGAWRVEPGLDRIERGGESVALEPKAMDLLLCLARRAGETVTKATILEEVWGGAFVVEAVIPKTISALRAALGDDAASPTYILTVPRRGYRLVAAVEGVGRAPEVAAVAAPAEVTRRPVPESANWRTVAGWLAAALVAILSLAWYASSHGAESEAPPQPGPGLASREPSDAVQKLVLEARHLWGKRGIDSLERANDLLLEAVKEAPESAEVQGWLALSFITRGNYLGGFARTFPLAAEHARLSLELDPRSAIAHCASGALAFGRDRDPRAAIRWQRQAVELDPNLIAARQFLAEALSIVGRHDEALAEIDQAILLDPLSAVLHGVRGLILQQAGRPVAALEAYDRVLVLEPSFGWVHQNRAYAFFRIGRESEARASVLKAVESTGEQAEHLVTLRAFLDAEGFPGYWIWHLARLEAIRAEGATLRPMQYAEALAGTGRIEEALQELRRASRTPDGELFFHSRISPAFDPLRERPEYVELYAPYTDG